MTLRALLALTALILLGQQGSAQTSTYFGIPWGSSQQSVTARLRGIGIELDRDYGNGQVRFISDSSALVASFSQGRLVQLSESYELDDAQGANDLFHLLADSLRQALGTADSVGLQVRVWRRGPEERVYLGMFIPPPSNSAIRPSVSIDRKGPGHGAYWSALIDRLYAEYEAERYAWAVERAPAPRWTRAYGENNQAIFFERDRATRTAQGTWRVWTRWVYREIQRDNDGTEWDLVLTDSEIDCGGRRSRNFEGVTYNGSRVIDSSTRPTTWSRWLPESVGEGAFEEICRSLRSR